MKCSPQCDICEGEGEVLISHANNDGGFISDEEYGTCPKLLEAEAELLTDI